MTPARPRSSMPGYQRVDEPAGARQVRTPRGASSFPHEPGLNLNEMMKQVGKQIRGLFVMGEDIVLSEPNVTALEAGLNNSDFLVMQDAFLNETARFADVVFPAAVFVEKEGVFTNSERRVQRVRKAVEPPGEARADWRILVDLANACGASWHYDGADEVYAEMAKDAPKFAGITHERLEEGQTGGVTGLQWPCPTPGHEGTTFLHEGGVLRGKGLFQAVEYRPSAELPDEDWGLLLSTGRTLYHYNAATQTRRESGLVAKQAECFVEIHPRDAKKRGIADEDQVEVTSRRGSIRARAVVSRQVRPGCIWLPLHFAEARANLLTNDVGDSVTGTAEYKVCAAEVRKLEPAGGERERFRGSFMKVDGPKL